MLRHSKFDEKSTLTYGFLIRFYDTPGKSLILCGHLVYRVKTTINNISYQIYLITNMISQH